MSNNPSNPSNQSNLSGIPYNETVSLKIVTDTENERVVVAIEKSPANELVIVLKWNNFVVTDTIVLTQDGLDELDEIYSTLNKVVCNETRENSRIESQYNKDILGSQENTDAYYLNYQDKPPAIEIK